jgi:excisionase family DNA binding protein
MKLDRAGESPTRWLTPDQAAEYLQVSRVTLINLVNAGTIPRPRALTTRILRYDREAIDRALAGATGEVDEPRLGDVDWSTREERKRAWQERPRKKRSWTDREAREREERSRVGKQQDGS